jgi:copper(I)-binding protein
MVSRETTRPLRKLVPAVAIGVSALLGIVGCSAGQVAQTAEMEPAVNGNMGQVGNLLLRDVIVASPENGEAYKTGEDAPLLLTIANVGDADDELVDVTTPAGKVQIIGKATIPGESALQVVRPGENPAASESPEPSQPQTTGSATSGAETTGSEVPSSAQSPSSSGSPSSSQSPSSSESSVAPASDESSAPPVSTNVAQGVPDVVGTISLVITGLTGDLPFGKTVPVTFVFKNAGKVTVSLPVAAPATARAENRDSDMGRAEEGH